VRVREMVKEAFNVGFHDPLRPIIGNDLSHSPPCIVRAAPRAKALRAVAKLRFPDCLQNATEAILD
jgi:hypothetical protein